GPGRPGPGRADPLVRRRPGRRGGRGGRGRGRRRGGEDLLMTPEKAPTQAELEQRLEEVERERDEYLNDLKRVAADFENYRKRVARGPRGVVARGPDRVP